MQASEMTADSRNYTLDIFKLIAAIFVVFIHFSFTGDFGTVTNALARFAVPFFFICSGYFAYNNSIAKLKSKLQHIALMALGAGVFYFIFTIIIYIIELDPAAILKLVATLTSPSTVVSALCFNNLYNAYHLWYLLALIYIYMIEMLLAKFRVSFACRCWVSLVLLLINLALSEVLGIFNPTLHSKIPVYYTRNYLFMGYPFFTLGMLIRKHKDSFLKIHSALLLLGLMIGAVDAGFSIMLIVKNELYIGSVIFSFCLFVLGIKHTCRPSGFIVALSQCSAGVYIIHIAVGEFLNTLYKVCGWKITSSVWSNLKPALICVLSILFVLLFKYCVAVIKRKKAPMKVGDKL